jgi:ubiquinone/menaquinone biosynthesis C-methylase UbiE
MKWEILTNRLFEFGVGIQYGLLARRNYFMASSQYMNMGFWKATPQTLDEACRAMAQLVAEIGHFEPDDRILDVGFGFADQDLFWMEHFAPRQIVGLDIARFQVRAARRRVAEQAMADRIDLRRGSATAMQLDSCTFDKVVSLESAFHFATREKFFSEAYRVLRSGGRLVLTDMIPQATGSHCLNRVSPRANIYPREVYELKLSNAGFNAIELLSIREHVCVPFCEYIAARLQDPVIMRRVNPILRGSVAAAGDPEVYVGLDYVIATARKGPK